MRRNVVFPYRQVRPESVAIRATDWYRDSGPGFDVAWLPTGASIEEWSYDTPLKLGREITIDSDLLFEELGLSESDAQIDLSHSIRVGAVGMREVLHRETLPIGGSSTFSFLRPVNSEQLCEHLVLSSALTLRSEVKDVPLWAPSETGSICWADETRVDLEGHGSRFPMRDVSFAKNPRLADSAHWHLEWTPNLLHYSFNSAVTLYLNADKVEFVARIQEGDELLLQELMAGVLVEICSCLLADVDIDLYEQDFPEGSLGSVARTWLLHARPGRDLAEIRGEYLRKPSVVLTSLRSLAALG